MVQRVLLLRRLRVQHGAAKEGHRALLGLVHVPLVHLHDHLVSLLVKERSGY